MDKYYIPLFNVHLITNSCPNADAKSSKSHSWMKTSECIEFVMTFILQDRVDWDNRVGIIPGRNQTIDETNDYSIFRSKYWSLVTSGRFY